MENDIYCNDLLYNSIANHFRYFLILLTGLGWRHPLSLLRLGIMKQQQYRILNPVEPGITLLELQVYSLYNRFLEKYSNSLSKMNLLDQIAFCRRLYTMAKRKLIPYGEEFVRKPYQMEEQPDVCEPLRIRAIRSFPNDQ